MKTPTLNSDALSALVPNQPIDWLGLGGFITSLVTLIITGYMAYLAKSALSTWKDETLGKRRITLAEEVFVSFREIVNLIKMARHDVIFWQESNEIVKEWKLDDDNQVRFLAPGYRLNRYWDKVETWFFLKDKAYVYWGDEIYNLFIQLKDIIIQVQFWSGKTYQISRDKNLRVELNDQFEKGKNIILAPASFVEDQIQKEIDAILLEIEENLSKYLEHKKENWKKLDGSYD